MGEARLPVRLLCLDIDGTLLDSLHRLPEENGAAVRKTAARGIPVCLISARPPSSIRPIMEELGVDGVIAAYSGGLLTCGGRTLCDTHLDEHAARAALDAADRVGVYACGYRGEDWFVSSLSDVVREESRIAGILPTVAELDREIQEENGGVHKLLYMGAPEKIDQLQTELSGAGLPAQFVRSKEEYMEILPEGVGKAHAVEQLCQALGISVAETMAIGDHDVDAGMLSLAGYGVAMANSSPLAREAARLHTGSNDAAGVAEAINKWVLGDRSHIGSN